MPDDAITADMRTIIDAAAGRATSPAAPAAAALPAGLTEREAEVLRLVAQGLTNPQIGERLFISPRTVNAHLTTIYRKLEVSTRAGAASFAVAHGLE